MVTRVRVTSPETSTLKHRMLQPVFFFCTAIINEHGGIQGTAAGLIISDRGRQTGKEKDHRNL